MPIQVVFSNGKLGIVKVPTEQGAKEFVRLYFPNAVFSGWDGDKMIARLSYPTGNQDCAEITR